MKSNKPNIESIFEAAIEMPPESRPAFLDNACGDDDQLRRRVERLLEAKSQARSFLESPAPELEATSGMVPVEQPGMTIGHYRLLQEIGEGGMGIVYMAEQKEPVKRRVALKIIKPGMDSRDVITRF